MKPLDLYTQWKASPTPGTLTPLIQSLNPTIKKSLSTHGFDKDPNMRTAAMLHLSKGMERYDPEKASLNTWATNELKRMPRIGHKQRHAVPMPERAALDLTNIRNLEKDLQYRLGREPTAVELADESGLSTRRIGSIRARFGVPTMTEGMTENAEGIEASLSSGESNREQLVMELIYGESSPVDQQILDFTFGWHGQPKLKKTEIARRLKRSPANVTQRAAVLAQKIDDLDMGTLA